MQSPSKLSAVFLSGPPAFSGPQGWAELPDDLLHSIVARLGSFSDHLGFAATCPSWRAAFSSYPSKSTLCTKLPHVRVQGPLLPAANGCRELYACRVIDPANQNTSLHCHIPVETADKMIFIGSSYGNAIYIVCNGYCHIIDVLTGVEVSTPRLPSSTKFIEFSLKGTLTTPLASPNSHPLVGTQFSLFDLPVGNDSWSELGLPYQFELDHISEFSGRFIVSNSYGRSYALQLAPQLGYFVQLVKF